ncbi:hypothetical protein Taro_028290 [Colocasia esculenta]|uniref:Uncharacterized protein n=1 Tax=Colocasia esculenta TaxID=4460 RepID=A0A843VAU7_COLES|nr:hypothetical protein [Colocasia esculenta]
MRTSKIVHVLSRRATRRLQVATGVPGATAEPACLVRFGGGNVTAQAAAFLTRRDSGARPG